MQFKCLNDSKHRFSVDKPEDIEGVWHWKSIVHCPYCGSANLEEVLMVASTKTKYLSIAREENKERTRQAAQQAADARRRDAEANPDTVLAPLQRTSRFGGDSVRIKKSIIDSLDNKKPEDYG